jgi:AraC-like DNA-binding protein
MVVMNAANADEWQEIASRSFVPLECAVPAPSFQASLEEMKLSRGVSVCTITSDPAVIMRTPRLTACAGSDDLHLSVQVRSAAVIHQGSASAAMSPGSVAAYATNLPYQLDYFGPGQRLIVMQVSRAALGLPSATIASAPGSIAVTDSAGRRVFSSYMRSLVGTSGRLDPQTRDDFARVAVELAATMLRSSEAGHRVVPDSRESLLYTVQSFIRDQAPSAELTIEDIARTHYVSRRKLYDLFAQIQTTPSAYLREERLRSASTLLTDPDVHLPIAAIAFQCGFADVTTFTRAFRRRFEMTPRDWRFRHRSPGEGIALRTTEQ